MQLRGTITSVSAKYAYILVGATLLGVGFGWWLRGPSTNAMAIPVASASTVPPGTTPREDDWLKESPLHGSQLSPKYTAVPLGACPGTGGEFCPYESCAASVPKTTNPGKLWNTYVVSGKDGPVVVCEWREKWGL